MAEDPRSRRSRQALIDAMTSILRETPLATSPSITDVVRRAAVSRPTFYQHFGDLTALTRAAALARLQAAFARIPATALGETWTVFARSTFRVLLAELAADAHFYGHALGGQAQPALVDEVVGFLAAHLLEQSPLGPIIRRHVDGATAEEHARFLAAGSAWHVTRWLRSHADDPGTATDLDTMVDRLSDLLVVASGASGREIAAVRAETALDAPA